MAVKLPSLDLQAETMEMKRTLQHRRSLFRTGSTALILSCDRPDGREQFGSPGRLFSDLPDPESLRRRMERLPSVPGTPEGVGSKRASDPDGLASWPLCSWARPGRSS
ncbi:Kidins220 [Symbiodinium sp. CCMP2592]|nr:Kidins220 [Symbiodinium sp. CCMP2592]